MDRHDRKTKPLDCPNTTADKTAAKTTYGEANTSNYFAYRALLDITNIHIYIYNILSYVSIYVRRRSVNDSRLDGWMDM